MEKLEKAKKKHDHKGTKILKLIIFSCVMLAPFYSILVRCLYILNPNAKDSYYGDHINEQENIYTYQMKAGNTYYLSGPTALSVLNNNGGNTNSQISVSNVQSLTETTYNYENVIAIGFYSTNINTTIAYFFTDTTNYFSHQIANNFSIKFIYNGQTSGFTSYIANNPIFYSIKYNKYSYLDNAFEYSINQLGESNYYNWTQNTGIYNGLNAMCTGLGVNNVIAILLTYWALCTAIYIVFDIIIELFTKLTHFINAD